MKKCKKMNTIENWLEDLKQQKVELVEFIDQIESFFSSNGFDGTQYETKTKSALELIEKEIINNLKKQSDASNQEN
jgi:hypothetical protein